MKEILIDDLDEHTGETLEEYDKNLEQMALSMITKGSIEHKIKDFKSRVYGLLILYIHKAKFPGHLLKALNPILTDIQPIDVPKLDLLVRESLKKAAVIDTQDLLVLVEFYQRLLLK